jgi:hypothetical protein
VVAERQEVGYPFTPTLRAKRASTTAFVEVDGRIQLSRLTEWAAYGRSCSRDTRVWVALDSNAPRSGSEDVELKKIGVGILVVDAGTVSEILPSQDLALNLALPDITTAPRPVQKILGRAYEHFDRAEWRECFNDACLALETTARSHLWKGIRSGRIILVSTAGKQVSMTKPQVDRLTMGQLAGQFALIQPQSRSDRVIGDALKRVNPDRVPATPQAHCSRRDAPPAERGSSDVAHLWRALCDARMIHRSDGTPH